MVSIRPYAVGDANVVWQAVRESMRDLTPWMPWCHPNYAIEESRSWLESQVKAFAERTAFEFAIVAQDGGYLGGIGLNQLDAANRRANLGYWVRSTATRRGTCTSAVLQLRDWAMKNTDLVRLEILVAADNAPSLRVAEKSGAVREGVLRKRLLLNGVAHDAVLFSLLR
jgi:RimJ/RimL family protein N-acetyltransferase